MISASLSLSLPRLGWKSTSTPRSLKICTAAGESASEMRTLGLDMGMILKRELRYADLKALMLRERSRRSGDLFSLSPFLRGEGWGEGQLQTRCELKEPLTRIAQARNCAAEQSDL